MAITRQSPRAAIEEAKRADDGILERGRLPEQYGKSTNNAIKELVRRQNAAHDKISAAINETTKPTRAAMTEN